MLFKMFIELLHYYFMAQSQWAHCNRTYDQTNIICPLKIQNRPLSIAVLLLHRLQSMSTFVKSSALVKERQKRVYKASLMLMVIRDQ